MNFKTILFANFKQKFWGLVIGLMVYVALLFFTFLPALGTIESLGLYFLFLTLYFIPASWLMGLGLYALFSAYKKERSWRDAVGHLFISLIFGVLFLPFFLLVTLTIFGFS